MNTKFLLTAFTYIVFVISASYVNSESVATDTSNTVKTSDGNDKFAKLKVRPSVELKVRPSVELKVRPSVDINRKNKKKFRLGIELVGRARCDWYKVSFKADFKEKSLNVNKTVYTISLAQTDITNAITAIINNFPGLQNIINNLTDEQKNTVLKNFIEMSFIDIRDSNPTDDALRNVQARITNICNGLGINIQQFALALQNQPRFLPVLQVCVSKPELIKDNLTKDEFVTAALDVDSKAISSEVLKANNSGKGSNYVNWDIGGGAFANYSITDNVYLIGGATFLYDLAGSKGRKVEIKGLNSSDNSTTSSVSLLKNLQYYSIKYAITPKIGIGIQCNKRFAIEFSLFDQITKAEYDCSPIYKVPMFDAIRKLAPGITGIFPDKKQSNWINRFGAELGFRFNINDMLFTKLGIFYLFPRNIAKKIQPFDLKLQSVGASLSLGVTF